MVTTELRGRRAGLRAVTDCCPATVTGRVSMCRIRLCPAMMCGYAKARWGSAFLGGNLMSDALSFTELDEQRVELLPARTVLSCFNGGYGGDEFEGGDGGWGGDAKGGYGGDGGDAVVANNVNNGFIQINVAIGGPGGWGGDAYGGDADGGDGFGFDKYGFDKYGYGGGCAS
jgi:hypothetical protein